ncbi:alpha/beta-hydrolase [Atractiella rhizophila]|nr:alpha/beta-hydrolase [Atractiella rhizophila]
MGPFSVVLAALSLLVGTTLAAPVSRLEKRVDQSVYDELLYYFRYASSAYGDSCAKPNGNTLVLQIEDLNTDTEGFIARDDNRKEIVVALRGSSTIDDAFTDVSILQKPYSSAGVTPADDVYVHGGFLDAWNSVAQIVIDTVKGQLASHSDYTIVTSGHSLGGALSSLAAVSMKGNFPNSPVRMYTYGQPRTGNNAWAFWVNSLFGENAKRGVNADDGVPTLIPVEIGYRHHGIEYWTKDFPATASNTVKCAADGEDPNCSASIPSGGINLGHTTYYNTLAIVPYCS